MISKDFSALREWDEDLLEEALDLLKEDLPLDPGAPGGMTRYRQSLTLRQVFLLLLVRFHLHFVSFHIMTSFYLFFFHTSFFYKFWLEGCRHLGLKLPPGTESVLGTYCKDFPKASQYFQIVSYLKVIKTL